MQQNRHLLGSRFLRPALDDQLTACCPDIPAPALSYRDGQMTVGQDLSEPIDACV